MIHRDNREIVDTCDYLTIGRDETVCKSKHFDRDQRAGNQYCRPWQILRMKADSKQRVALWI
jgi:hypothetical protein